MRHLLIPLVSFAFVGCAPTGPDSTATGTPRPAPRPEAPAAAAMTTGPLGTTVAALGDPAEAGLWLRTPLATGTGSGRIRDVATGREVAVTLIGLGGDPGAGSALSLAAFQALGRSPADLVTLEVIGG